MRRGGGGERCKTGKGSKKSCIAFALNGLSLGDPESRISSRLHAAFSTVHFCCSFAASQRTRRRDSMLVSLQSSLLSHSPHCISSTVSHRGFNQFNVSSKSFSGCDFCWRRASLTFFLFRAVLSFFFFPRIDSRPKRLKRNRKYFKKERTPKKRAASKARPE